ncbi:MAG TPA: hypothetical protein VKE74_28315 [Gemmataceae bacterium]|nr:hypothetical protein [Gemmataceae bacterium]
MDDIEIEFEKPPVPRGGVAPGAVFPKPAPQESWLRYDNRVSVRPHDNVIPVVTLPKKPLTAQNDLYGVSTASGTSPGGWDTADPLPSDPRGLQLGSGKVQKDAGTVSAYRRTRPVVYVTMEGAAVRAGYPVPRPDLLDVAGIRLVPANREGSECFEHQLIGNAGVPLYGARWRLRYLVPDDDEDGGKTALGPIDVPPNSIDGVEGGAI